RMGTVRTENDVLAYVQVAPPDVPRFALKQVWELPTMYLASTDIPTLEHGVMQISAKIRALRGRGTLELDNLKGNCYSSLMTRNSRLATAVHIMSSVAYAGDEGTTSEAIAKSLRTNPVVVRKILKLLERKGLVVLRQGRHGGVGLRHPPSRITLGQIYKAVESENGVFAERSQVHDRCVVACAMKRRLGPIFNAANDAVEQALSKTSLAELVRDVG